MNGFCPIHRHITLEEAKAKKQEFPNAKFAVHPECEPEVVKLADFIGSTSQILSYCEKSGDNEFIIGTEYGVIERLRFFRPEKKYHLLTPSLVCPNMKKTTMQDLYNCLSGESSDNIVELPDSIIDKANKPLEKMLLLG
jgi:quinolinate synthase